MDKETIGRRLRRLRRAARITQTEIERRTGGLVSNTTVCHIETGRSKSPSCETVGLIARALGVCPCLLAGWKEGET